MKSAIDRTKSTWSSNPECVPATFFKRITLGILRPLSIIFRRSLDTGAVPSLYKTAYIAPVHEKGLRSDPRNKRPVSLAAVTWSRGFLRNSFASPFCEMLSPRA